MLDQKRALKIADKCVPLCLISLLSKFVQTEIWLCCMLKPLEMSQKNRRLWKQPSFLKSWIRLYRLLGSQLFHDKNVNLI